MADRGSATRMPWGKAPNSARSRLPALSRTGGARPPTVAGTRSRPRVPRRRRPIRSSPGRAPVPSRAAEPDARVRPVAEWLVLRAAAAAQARRGDPLHGATGAGADLEVARDLEGPVLGGHDRERAVALRERLARLGGGLAAGGKGDTRVRAVAERLVLRGPAPTERRAEHGAVTLDGERPVDGQRTVLSDANDVDLRSALSRAAIGP